VIRARSLPILLLIILASLAMLAFFLVRVLPVSSTRIIAVPDSVSDEIVLDALGRAGIQGAIGASNIMVPISDFSGIIMVALREARSRTITGDPRRTPLLDSMEASFYMSGTDDLSWRIIYIPMTPANTDPIIADALSELGIPWAWDAIQKKSGSVWLWIPALAWSVWLVIRRPYRFRLEQIIYSAACLPIMLHGSLESFLLASILESAIAAGVPILRAKWAKRLPLAILPYLILATVLVFLETDLIPYILLAGFLSGLLMYLKPWIRQLMLRRWVHQPPVFTPLQAGSLKKGQHILLRSVLAQLCIMLVLEFLATTYGSNTRYSQEALLVERSMRSNAGESEKLVNNHLVFQFILTYGRLGEAKWGKDDYSLAYRYAELEGRLSRILPETAPQSLSGLEDMLKEDLKRSVFILNQRRPLRMALQ